MNDTTISDETKRQIVILAFSVIGTVVTVGLFYYLTKPDTFKTLKMRAALTLKRVAQKQVDTWQDLADKAATMYNRERP